MSKDNSVLDDTIRMLNILYYLAKGMCKFCLSPFHDCKMCKIRKRIEAFEKLKESGKHE